MLTAIDLIHERLAGGLDLGDRGIFFAQVDVLWHDVGLRKLHRRLHPTLAGRVRRLTGQHRHAVLRLSIKTNQS